MSIVCRMATASGPAVVYCFFEFHVVRARPQVSGLSRGSFGPQVAGMCKFFTRIGIRVLTAPGDVVLSRTGVGWAGLGRLGMVPLWHHIASRMPDSN